VLRDAREIPAGTVLDTDVCITGVEVAGITLGRELASAPFRVTVLARAMGRAYTP
jgi:2-polyprenyl-6-methoxyphenol hydroxylase-like FAD-dependent oxidoreductase